MLRALIGSLSFALVVSGCASAPGDGAAAPNGPSTETANDDTSPPAEDEAAPAAKKSKSAQCEELGDAIQTSIEGGTKVVNLNDRPRIEALSQAWTEAADRVARFDGDLPELVALRDDYVGLARGMSDALAETITAGSDPAKKAALARYHELNAKTDSIVDRFNDACGA